MQDVDERLTTELACTNTEFTLLKERHRQLLSVLTAKDDESERLRRELSAFAGAHANPARNSGQADDAASVLPLPRR
ncbi:hypothetical protein [Streptomyces sp. NBC_01013]|uniref:hypothetical protein n=1 Tax=Streptomyces sp. NBC_01013 TaxID=2903718 RepID=UPI003863D043|nr:hypothetical protein OG538_00245 [Streptomyces sp. NBC_01013]